MATVHRVHIPSAEKIYNGTGKTLDDAIKDAQKKIPRHLQGHGFNKQTKEVTPPKGERADVPVRCKVIDIRFETGGFTGLSEFHVRVIED